MTPPELSSSKQLTNKLNKIDAYLNRDAEVKANLGFLTKMFVVGNLPHTPTQEQDWIRKNGKYMLRLSAGEKYVNETRESIGLPYGPYARLILMWITTQALRNKTREIPLKQTLVPLMREMGIQPTGGERGTITHFKNQFIRLCCCRISIEEQNQGENLIGTQFFIVEDKYVKWLQDDNDKIVHSESRVILSEKFYEQVIKSSIPFDFDVVKAIKQSSIAIDTYVWLTYRAFTLNQPTFISWRQIQEQMGTQYSDLRNFMRRLKKVITHIQVFYPEIKLDYVNGGLKLYPCKSHISVTKNNLQLVA